jgi:hypothetical protein
MSTPKINKVEAQKNVVEIKLPLDEKETPSAKHHQYNKTHQY